MQTANQQRAKQNATFGCLGAIVLLFLIAWVWGKASPKPAEPAPVGSRGTLSVASDPTVLLAVDNVAFDELAKSLIAKDWVGVASLIDQGRAFETPRGTRALVIDEGYGTREVRLEDGPQVNQAGWVPMEWIHNQ